jgi:hypothetical protein
LGFVEKGCAESRDLLGDRRDRLGHPYATGESIMNLPLLQPYSKAREAAAIDYGSNLVAVRSEAFTAVTMKNAVFCYIKTQFAPPRKHITYRLKCPVG